jgi:hypothetical protein
VLDEDARHARLTDNHARCKMYAFPSIHINTAYVRPYNADDRAAATVVHFHIPDFEPSACAPHWRLPTFPRDSSSNATRVGELTQRLPARVCCVCVCGVWWQARTFVCQWPAPLRLAMPKRSLPQATTVMATCTRLERMRPMSTL